ncbi:DUF2207 domain-containing protein [Micropruina sp.]|uniref:DUF2207 domain-containing protein n=1 Tax=Micropruina sp. TaxID=2737536 RepID=UPI0039E2CEEE
MTWMWVVAGVAVVLLLVWAWRAQQRKFADELFAGLTPGLAPAPGQADQRVPVPGGGEYTGEVAVAFSPPRGVRPGLAGTVVDGKPESRDVMATIVDLAARGHLTITVVEDPSARGGKDWELHVADAAPVNDVPDPIEQELLHALFTGGPDMRLSSLPRQGNHAFNDHQYALANQSYEQGYFRLVTGMQPVRIVWIAAGLLLLLSFVTGAGWLTGAGVLAALGAAVIGSRSNQRPVRTAEGTALRIQTLGFKRYLETAEKEQFAYEEAAEIFSKYLPWAIVLGVAAHWTKVFGDLAAQARADGYDDDLDVLWLGVVGWGVHDAMFTLAMFSAMDGFDGAGLAGAGLEGAGLDGAFDGAGFGDAFGDGGMFDSGTIDGLGADAGGAFGDLGGSDFSAVDSGGSWGGDFGGGDWGGFGGGDFGGGGD